MNEFGVRTKLRHHDHMKSGFVRIAAGIPTTRVGHPQENADAIAALWALSDARNAAVVVFPELALSGYTARDLFLQDALLDACQRALIWLRNLSRDSVRVSRSLACHCV